MSGYQRKVVHLQLINKEYKTQNKQFNGISKIEAKNDQLKVKVSFNNLDLKDYEDYDTYLVTCNNDFSMDKIGSFYGGIHRNSHVFYSDDLNVSFDKIIGITVLEKDKLVLKGFVDEKYMKVSMNELKGSDNNGVKKSIVENESNENHLESSSNIEDDILEEKQNISNGEQEYHTEVENLKGSCTDNAENNVLDVSPNACNEEPECEMEGENQKDSYSDIVNNNMTEEVKNISNEEPECHIANESIEETDIKVNDYFENDHTNELDQDKMKSSDTKFSDHIKVNLDQDKKKADYKEIEKIFEENIISNPFGEEYPYECVQLNIMDLIFLPVFKNKIKRNPFIINSYVTHKHFLLIKDILNERYMLGIPDYENRYSKQIGKIYNLENFQRIPYDDLYYGYWIIAI